MATGGRFGRVNIAQVRRVISGRGGMLDTYMGELADKVEVRARRKAPEGTKPSPIGEPPLKDSIEQRRFDTKTGPVYLVGSPLRKAAWVHGPPGGGAGTEPHSYGGNPRLVFRGTHAHAGRIVAVFHVNHPGIAEGGAKGNKGTQPFISEALAEVMREENL